MNAISSREELHWYQLLQAQNARQFARLREKWPVKIPWHDSQVDASDLFDALAGKVQELHAMGIGEVRISTQEEAWKADVQKHCDDIANYAMMLADKVTRGNYEIQPVLPIPQPLRD